MSKTLVLKPRVSEKAYGLSQDRNTYVFTVPLSVSKQAIAQAVQAQFSVGVVDVNTTHIKGKTKRSIRRGQRGRPAMGSQSNFKKAYVTLKDGDSIALFAAEEEKKPVTKSAEAAKDSNKPEDKTAAKPKRRFGRSKA